MTFVTTKETVLVNWRERSRNVKLSTRYLDYAKSGLFMAFGAVTDDAGNKIRIEVTDDQLTAAAEIALEYLTSSVFGPDVYLTKDAA